MKKIFILTALVFNPVSATAGNIYECNNAVNKTASHLRVQASMKQAVSKKTRLSQSDLQAMMNTSKTIVNESERMILLCQFNRELTENVVDIIIKNTEKVEQLAFDLGQLNKHLPSTSNN